jgi:hypothetical protein
LNMAKPITANTAASGNILLYVTAKYEFAEVLMKYACPVGLLVGIDVGRPVG